MSISSRNVNRRESLFRPLQLHHHHHHHRRGHNFNYGIATEDNLDLFSINRSTLFLPSSHDNVSAKLERLSVESEKLARSGIDDHDLLSSMEGGKHEYDWLLTPPRTPDFPSLEGESQPTLVPQRSSLGRPTSNTNALRLSITQSEINNHSRPAKSSSVTRSSISSPQHNTYSSNKSSSILNTSTASVSSQARPSSPITPSPTTARPSTPSSRSSSSRPSTPSKVRLVPTNSFSDKSRTSQGSWPFTSSSRPHIPTNLHSPSAQPARSLSRPSTPTRRHSIPSPSTTLTHPVVPPDFPLEIAPNLRTTLPDRLASTRSNPPSAVTLKANSETHNSVTMSRRQSSPIVKKGRLSEPTAKNGGHANANGQYADVIGSRRVPYAPEEVARKSIKSSTTATDNKGFGRIISKKSLDMAIRQMNSSGSLRSHSSATLFPQSIRSSTPKTQPTRGLSAPTSVDMNGSVQNSNNGACLDAGIDINRINGIVIDKKQHCKTE